MRPTGNRCWNRRRHARERATLHMRRYTLRCAFLVATGLLAALYAGTAQAEPAEQRIAITGGGGTHRIGVHPAYVTVLAFPSPIIRVVRSDATHFIIEATDRRVFLRPLEAATPGTVANLHVVTEDALVTVLLHVTEQPADAATHVAFTDERLARPARAPRRRVALGAAGVLGAVTIGDDSRLFVGGLEAGLVHPHGATRSIVAQLALTRAWYAPVAIAPVGATPPLTGDMAMATVQTVRLLGGYRVHRGQRLRAHATVLAGMQRWWLHERERLLNPEQTATTMPVGSWRSTSYTDGVAGMDVGLDITLWPRWHAGLGVRALRAWGIDSSAYDSLEGWLSLQWL
jgi:hypothetical protein